MIRYQNARVFVVKVAYDVTPERGTEMQVSREKIRMAVVTSIYHLAQQGNAGSHSTRTEMRWQIHVHPEGWDKVTKVPHFLIQFWAWGRLAPDSNRPETPSRLSHVKPFFVELIRETADSHVQAFQSVSEMIGWGRDPNCNKEWIVTCAGSAIDHLIEKAGDPEGEPLNAGVVAIPNRDAP